MKLIDEKPYQPLSERLNQDVWHDNFVPKYSALASAQPSLLVVIGVWLIFGAWPLIGLVRLLEVAYATDLVSAIGSLLAALFLLCLSVPILARQTSRYVNAKPPAEEAPEE